MIRKSIYILCASLVLTCSACDDWLTVQPKTTLVADNLFKTDKGVLQALDGAYLLSAVSIYRPDGYMGGGGFVEYLACTWSTTHNDLPKHIYNIDNVRFGNNLDDVFGEFYRIIASLNPLIEGLEENKADLKEEYYNMVKGEALALRASLHLDLIRIWGPMPSRINTSMEYLPYVTINSVKNYTYYTFDKYMELLLSDLNEAEELLAKSDPILTYPADGSTDYKGDWTDRKSHFNYYGVLGLQARARLWMNDKEGAIRYAKLVKEAKNGDGTSKFTLATSSNYGNRLFYPEHLCGIDQKKYDYQKYGFANLVNLNSYYNMNYSTFVEDLFNNNKNDLRYKEQWSSIRTVMGSWARITRKYDDMYPSTESATNMPVVRLAEMYLIIMEAGTLDEANAAYQELCVARDVEYVPLTNEDRRDRVMWEYIREFIAEGQNFSTYKRFAVKRMLWQDEATADCEEAQYVLPLPPSEYKER